MWHCEQLLLLVWRNVHLDPVLWQLWHEPDRWPPGRAWHEAQLALPLGWLNLQLLLDLWQVVQEPLL